MLNYIEVGKKEGATVLCGGNGRPSPSAQTPDEAGGFYIEPTVFIDCQDDMTVRVFLCPRPHPHPALARFPISSLLCSSDH